MNITLIDPCRYLRRSAKRRAVNPDGTRMSKSNSSSFGYGRSRCGSARFGLELSMSYYTIFHPESFGSLCKSRVQRHSRRVIYQIIAMNITLIDTRRYRRLFAGSHVRRQVMLSQNSTRSLRYGRSRCNSRECNLELSKTGGTDWSPSNFGSCCKSKSAVAFRFVTI